MIKKILRRFSGLFLGRLRLQRLFSFFLFLGLKGLNFGGGSYPSESGEAFVIEYFLKLNRKDRPVIFDVGANKGDYTSLWLKFLADAGRRAEIFAFEPNGSLCLGLSKLFSEKPDVKVFGLALSDKDGEAVLYSDFNGSGMASLAKRNLEFLKIDLGIEEKIKTRTLDGFCREQKVEYIDFLKLDVEGFEFAVLKGAEGMLSGGNIGYIQFEFGGADIDARVFFKDFFYLLRGKYHIYRILRDGLWPISRYSELDEIFITTNYLAVLKSGSLSLMTVFKDHPFTII